MPKMKITKYLPLYIGAHSVMVRKENGAFVRLGECDVEGVVGICSCGGVEKSPRKKKPAKKKPAKKKPAKKKPGNPEEPCDPKSG